MSNKKKKVKHPKMDPYLISKTKYELDYVVARFKLKGIKITTKDVIAAIKTVGNSRKKVYNALLIRFN